MKNTSKNPNSILFLYEGETEAEFYKKVFALKLKNRMIKRNFGNLKGVYSLNEKVKSKIKSYLSNSSFDDCNQIHVFVAFDREGERHYPSALNTTALIKEFISPKSRIKSINEIIATQDLESWFFHDMVNIYKFLKVPKIQRKLDAFPNVDKTNNRKLSKLFHKYDKHYQKGKKVEGFIDCLDINRICENVLELKTAIEVMENL